MPAPPAMICAYIADHAGGLSVATIQRRIATLSKAHEAASLPNPCRSELVKAMLQGLRRKHGTAQRQARPLLRDDLFAVLDKMGDSLKDTRDRALLLLGLPNPPKWVKLLESRSRWIKVGGNVSGPRRISRDKSGS